MKKKILFFIESLAGGGAEKVLSDIVCNLDIEKFDITVCTVTDEDVYQERVSKACNYRPFLRKEEWRAGGIRRIRYWVILKLIYLLPATFVYRLFIRERFDIEIAFVEGFATKLIANSRNKESKKIAWLHSDMMRNSYADTYYRSLSEHKKIYYKFDSVIAVSEYVREMFESKFSFENEVIVQYNPVDESDIWIKSSESINEKREKNLLLGTIGRLEKVKGYGRLMKAINDLGNELENVQLWIIGEGSQKEKLQNYINDNHLGNNVKLWGFQENPYKYIKMCDAFICSSYAEGFSTAATESLILHKPIFTVNCSGMKELFGDKHCGEIVDNTDEALYDLLKKLASGQIKVEAYHNAVEKRAEEFKIAKRMEEIEKILLK